MFGIPKRAIEPNSESPLFFYKIPYLCHFCRHQAIGDQGLFAKEFEHQLLGGAIDLSIHDYRDL